MPDDLRFCVWGCCHFVNNRPTTRIAYQLTAHAHELGLNSPEPDEIIIPCRKARARLRYSIESELGFYIGLRLPRSTGILAPETGNPLVFDDASGEYLRVATDDDIRRWNVARRRLSRIVRDILDGVRPSASNTSWRT
jgi:hypothetical protein